jgi:hypothetical protein
MKTFVITLAIFHALDALAGYLNVAAGDDEKPTGPWVRAASRILSLLVALWGAYLLGGAPA